MFAWLCWSAVLLFSSASAIAQGQSPAAPSDEAILFYSAGLDGVLVDPKDRALLGAIHMLEQRLAELPAELGAPPGVDRAIGTAWDLLTGPLTLQIWPAQAANADAPPVAVQLTAMPAGNDGAARLEQDLGDSLSMTGLRLTKHGGLQTAATPAGTLTLGTLDRGGRGAVFIGLNTVGDRPAPDLDSFKLPGSAKPSIAFRADFHRTQPFMDALYQAMGPESARLRESLESVGLSGPNAISIDAAAGFTDEHAVGTARYRGLRKVTADPDAATFGKAQLKMIPQDAIWLSSTSASFGQLDQFKPGDGGPDPIAMIAPIIGINLRTDLFDHFGRRCLAYRADSTGGGGLLSTIAIIELADPAAVADATGKLVARFNQFAAQQAKGYVRIRSWKQGELELFTLMTPGLPVPVEITWSIIGSNLVVAGGPAALFAAADQIRDAKSSILDNKSFTGAAGSKLDGLVSIQYLDTARLAPDGYGMLTLGAAALSNAVRSPTDPDRQPGILIPPYGSLFTGVRPTISIGRWDGDDLVVESRGDRSMLVNAAAASGTLGGVPVALIGAAAASGIYQEMQHER